MKNWKRLLALCLSGAMALSLFACKPGGSDADPSADPSAALSGGPDASADPNASASPEIVADLSQGVLEFSAGLSAGDTVLTVNGEAVPADLFLYWLDYNCYYFTSYYGVYGLSLSDYADDMIEEAVYFCVSQALLRQKAAELGCLPTDAQVQEARDSLDGETLEMLKSGYGLSDDSVNALALSNAYYNNVMEALTHEPSEEELEDYITAKGVYRVKHILLKTVDDSRQPLPDDQIAAKRAQAEDFLSQLREASDLPALFNRLMNEYSEDGRTDDGALAAPDGYLAAPGQMVSAFEEAGKALKAGELSGIVETEYGYHILLGLSLAPFTEEEEAQYRESFRPDAMDDLVQQWEAAADITRADILSTLNPADFYNRITAYRQALYEKDAVG